MSQGDMRTALAHSKECRERIEKLIREDPALKGRLDEAEARKTRYLAAEVERLTRSQGEQQHRWRTYIGGGPCGQTAPDRHQP